METPGEYGSLEEYFRHYRSPQQIAVPPRTFSEPGLLGPDDLPNLTVSDTGLGKGEGDPGGDGRGRGTVRERWGEGGGREGTCFEDILICKYAMSRRTDGSLFSI